MPTVLTATPPVQLTINRLRQAVAEESRFSPEELLDLINRGYHSAVARARALPTLTTLTVPAGSTTAPLPADWGETLGAFHAGRQLQPINLRHSTSGLRFTYFQTAGTFHLGLSDTDQQGANTVLLLYNRVPVDLGVNDYPEWGREHDELLRYYAAWRCVLASGGAQTIRKAQTLRQQFDAGVRDLRRQANLAGGALAGQQVKSLLTGSKGAPIAS